MSGHSLTADFELPPLKPVRRKRAVRSAQAVVRMLPSEMRRAQALSDRAGYASLSEWIRARAVTDDEIFVVLGDETAAELVKLRRDLNSGIGANLNQALHHANARAGAGQPVDEAGLADQVAQTRAALASVLVALERLLSPRGRV